MPPSSAWVSEAEPSSPLPREPWPTVSERSSPSKPSPSHNVTTSTLTRAFLSSSFIPFIGYIVVTAYGVGMVFYTKRKAAAAANSGYGTEATLPKLTNAESVEEVSDKF